MTDKLTREQIDEVIDALTMGDVNAAFAAGGDDRSLAGVAFARAAKRLGLTNGKDPLDAVSLRDVAYVGQRMTEAMGTDNPKSESTEG